MTSSKETAIGSPRSVSSSMRPSIARHWGDPHPRPQDSTPVHEEARPDTGTMTAAALPTSPRARAAVLAAGPVAAAVLVLTATGTVQLPSLEGALADLAESLGAWTY